jgi:ATP-binding cassette subfamily B protein
MTTNREDPVPTTSARRRLGILRAAVQRGRPEVVGSMLGLIVLMSVAGAGTALALKGMVDGAADGNRALALTAAAAGGVAYGINGAVQRAYGNLRDWLAAQVAVEVNTDTVRLAGEMPGTDHLERPEYADQVDLVRKGGRQLVGAAVAMADLTWLGVRVLLAVGLLAFVHPLLMLAPLFALPSVLLAGRAQKQIERATYAAAEPARTADHLHGLFTRPTAAMEMRVLGCADALDARARATWNEVARLRLSGAVRAAGAAAIGWVGVVLGYGGALVLVATECRAGRASAGDVLLTAQVVVQLRGDVNALSVTMRQVTSGLRLVDRYAWLADRAAAEHAAWPGTAAPPRALVEGIGLSGVSYRYPGAGRASLDGLDLFLPAGRTVAVVGLNGAGKTTLVKLLCGFHRPDAGVVSVDGVDLAQLDPVEWRAGVSGTFQDYVRLESTLAHSVGAGLPAAMDDEAAVRGALADADADGVVARLPNGLASPIGTTYREGAELSGGQWQKVAVARSMMKRRPLLLVLDEPTAALDPIAEHALYERYVGAAARVREEGGVVLLISHRFASVRMADLIVVLREGRVEDSGTHEELLERGGGYALMYRQQASAFA